VKSKESFWHKFQDVTVPKGTIIHAIIDKIQKAKHNETKTLNAH
jgi:hypothetical protein